MYEEEQVGKTREVRKAVPANKMQDLRWEIAETQSLEENQRKINMTLTLQMIVTITIMITTVLKQITAYMEKFSRVIEKITQVIRYTTTKASRNILCQNIKDFYKTAVLAVAIATNMTDRTSRNEPTHRNSRNSLNSPDMCENHMTNTMIRTSCSYLGTTTPAVTSTTRCITVSIKFKQKLTTEMETSEHKTLNNALVNRNEVLSRIWKLS